MASAAQPAREIPEKSLYRIGEVSRLTETKTFVLRFWESEFPTLQPVKSPAGHRLYRREDIETVFEIKRLLYEQGFTIAGARKHLAEKQGPSEEAGIAIAEYPQDGEPSPAIVRPALLSQPANNVSRQALLELREELLAILTLLKSE